MVSTNTPSNGARHRNNTLIFQQNSAKHHKAMVKTAQFSSISQNSLFTRFVLLLLMFFSISFFTKVNAQCTPLCGSTITVQLSSNVNGLTPLAPQNFFTNTSTCGVITVSPTSVDCSNIGVPVPITLTSNMVPNLCTGSQIMVMVVDQSAPVITCPANVTVDCTASTAPASTGGSATASDNCTATLPAANISFVDVTVASTGIGNCSSIERTWTATDGAATPNLSSCLQTITIDDTSGPTLDFSPGMAPADVTVDCQSAIPAVVAFSAMDNCTTTETTSDVAVGQGTDPNMCDFYNYTVNRTYTTTDNCGNIDQYTQVITIDDNVAPVIPAQTSTLVVNPGAGCTAAVSLVVAATDNCVPVANLQSFFEVKLQSSGAVVASGTGLNASGTYNVGLYDFEFTVIDPCGNNSTEVYEVNITDSGNPTARCNSNVTISVDSQTGMSQITIAAIDDNSTDTCTPQNLLAFSVVRNDMTGGDEIFCSDIGVGNIPVVLTVTDGNGNSNTCTSMIMAVESNPTAFCTNLSVTLDATGNYTFSAADLTTLQSGFADVCSMPALTFAYSQSTFTCADIGMNTVMVTATNSFGKSSTCNAVVTVVDLAAPIQSCAASYNAYLDEDGQVTIDPRLLLSGAYEIYMTSGDDNSGTANGFTEYSLTSPNGITFSFDWNYFTNDSRGADEDRLWYRIDGSPAVILKNSSIPANTGTVSITLLPGETFRIRVLTTDNMGGRAEVNLSNFSTALMALGDLNESNWVTRLLRSDGVAFISGNSIEIMDCTSPYDLVISSNPTVLDCDSIPTGVVTVTATDAFGNTSNCTTPVNVIDSIAPDFECADFTAQLDQSGNVVVEPGWFLDGARSLYLESSDNGTYPMVGTVDHTVRVKSAGSIRFRWDFESADTTNTGEVFGFVLNGVFTQISTTTSHTNVIRTVAVNTGDTFGFRIQSDNNTFNSNAAVRPVAPFGFTNDYDPVLWTRASSNNNGTCFIHGSLSDNCSSVGDLTLTINSATNQAYNCGTTPAGTPIAVTIDISDSASPANTKSCSANLTIIDNEPPIAVCPSSYSVTLGSNGEVDLSILPATMSIENNSIDNCAGTLTVTPNPMTLTCADIGTNTISYTVTDASGNTATCTNTITAQEGTAPQIACPADIIVQCENLPADTLATNAGMATATDNCSATTISFIDAVVMGANCVDIERTWTAVDVSGNASFCVQNIGIQDLTAPTLVTPATFSTPITAECDAVPAPPVVTFMDNCSANMTFDTLDSRIDTINGVDTFLVLPSAAAFYNYTITREWNVVDACGSSATQSQVVNVSDTQAPVVTFQTSLIVNTDAGVCQTAINGLSLKSSDIVDCAAYPYLIITNDSPFATANGSDISGTYPLGITTVTLTVTDPSNNVSNHVITIEVLDVETPNMNCEDDFDVTLSSAGVANISVINVDEGSNDACGLASLSINPTMFDCTDIGAQTVTLTGVDNNGNVGTCTTIVNVMTSATSSVTISCPADITVACPTVPDPSVTGTALFTTACGTGNLSHTDNPLSSINCGNILRTWTATDGTVSQSCVQTITMVDNNAPTLNSTVPTYPVQECTLPTVDDLMFSDDCTGNFAVTPTDTPATTGAFAFSSDPATCGYYSYNIMRTWQAIDDCGNSAAAINRTIQIRDTEAPVVTFPTPLVIPTDANACDAAINVDLKDYVTDCADDAFLNFSIDGATGGNSVISGTFPIGTHPFTLQVTDPCTNSTGVITINIQIEDQQNPTAVCIQNVVIVLDNTGNATINENDVDAGSTDNCTTIPNLVRTVAPASFTTADIGTPQQITLTIEDEANLTNTCTTNGTVVGGTVIDAADVTIPVAGMGTVPVTVSNFQDVTSFAFNIDVVDATVATVNSLSNVDPALAANGTFTTSAVANGYAVIWTATSTGSPITLADGSTLFEVDVTAVGNLSDVSVVDITANTVMKLIAGVATPDASTAIDGSITLFNPTSTFTFDVELNTEEGLPIANANVAQTGGNTNNIVSDNMGDAFGFTAPSGTTTTFTPSKNTDWKEGVTVNDAFLVLQHPNPTSTFGSGYKNIAADANADNIITGNDAILIFQLAVDPAITSIPGNTSWRFIHDTPDLSTTPNPWGLFDEFYTATVATNEVVNFIGVKVGDVDADADPLLRQTGTFEFLLDNQSIENTGERVEVEFKAKDFKGINGYQYTIDFEEKSLEYVEVIPGVLPNLSSFNFKDAKVADGQLTTGYINIDAVDLDDNDVLFTLVFESKSANFELKDAISASDNLIPMQVIESTGELKNNVELVFESRTSSTANTFGNNLELRQNVPNPFDSETIVGFTLPDATAIQLSFMDASGKLLHTIDGDYPQGYHEVTVNKEVLPTTGVVFYQLQTAHGTKVQKMIILE